MTFCPISAELARDMADPLPAERDEDGDPTGPWTRIDTSASDAVIVEVARIIEARALGGRA